jgi:nitrate reductase NapE component
MELNIILAFVLLPFLLVAGLGLYGLLQRNTAGRRPRN